MSTSNGPPPSPSREVGDSGTELSKAKEEDMRAEKLKRSIHRLEAEDCLGGMFYRILDNQYQNLGQLERGTDDRGTWSILTGEKAKNRVLTKEEKRVFAVNSYRSFSSGGIIFGVTLGGILGLLVRRRNRLLDKVIALPQSPQQKYSNLDHLVGIKGTSKKLANGRMQQQKQYRQQPPPSSWEDPAESPGSWETVSGQAELMISALAAVVAGVFSSWILTDLKASYEDTAKLPLQAGKSHLMHEVCPNLIELYQKVIKSSPESQHWIHERAQIHPAETAELLKSPELLALEPTDQELWAAPTSTRLEAAKHLLVNCQQRVSYIQDLKKKQQQQQHPGTKNSTVSKDGDDAEDEEEEPFDVPEPGVPPRYLGLDVEQCQQEQQNPCEEKKWFW